MISHLRIARGPMIGWMLAAATVSVVVGQTMASWLNLCGTSANSLVALVIGSALGMLLFDWIKSRLPQSLGIAGWKNSLCFVSALMLISLCWLLPSLLDATLLAGCETIGITWPYSSFMVMLFPALIVAIVTATAGLFFRAWNPVRRSGWIRSTIVGIPGAALLLITALPGMSWVPLAIVSTLMIAAVVTCRILLDHIAGSRWTDLNQSAEDESVDPIYGRLPAGLHYAAFAATGMLLIASSEILSRLVSGSLPLMIQTACLTALALSILSRPLTMKLLTTPALYFIALCTVALLPLLFLPLANFNLALNTSGFSAVLVLLIQSAQFAVLATAAFVPAVCVSRPQQSEISSRDAVLSLVSGMVLTLALSGLGASAAVLLAAGIAIQAATGLAHTFLAPRRESSPARRFATLRHYAMPAFGLLCVLLPGLGTTDSSKTSSLLFSERTAAAVELGVAQDLILQSQANRMIAAVATQTGEITVWRRTGNVFEFQRNGMPIGRVSTDTSVSPQPVEDILPAILALTSHAQPSRVLLLGDDTGACLRTCSHFPVQEIVAIRTDEQLTELANRLTWSGAQIPLDQDDRIRILHEPSILAVRRRELRLFDVVIATGDSVTRPSAACEYTTEFYQAARSRMTADAVFCQRFRQSHVGPQPLKETMATLMTAFRNVGIIQSTPGEILLLASDSEQGLIDPELMVRLQREHVRREIATAGLDWAQIAILPLLDAHDPLGIFSHEQRPPANSVSHHTIAMSVPFETIRSANKQAELQTAFGPHQLQILAAIPATEDHEEVKRRLSALAQEMEILAGMPDQPWTYRKSLQMEMKQSPRPPQDLVESRKISKVAHPLDMLRRDYFVSLGKALTAASRGELTSELISRLDRFTDNFEPLITHFAHYEIVRLHELSQHPSPQEEFRHRLHIVFFTSSTDASVRPVISALQQLVDQPSLIADESERYDMLNSLLQKMIERWEARTAWEPRSALRVQNDVEMSVGVANRAMEQMEAVLHAAHVERIDFYRRRRYVSAALISPLRAYRDQVLAHRLKAEKPPEHDTEDPNDVPLLINSGSGMNTN